MKLSTIIVSGNEKLCVCIKKGLVLMEEINSRIGVAWPEHMDELIKEEQLGPLNQWYKNEG